MRMHLTPRERSLQHLVNEFAMGSDAVEIDRQSLRNNGEFGDRRALAKALLGPLKAERGIS